MTVTVAPRERRTVDGNETNTTTNEDTTLTVADGPRRPAHNAPMLTAIR